MRSVHLKNILKALATAIPLLSETDILKPRLGELVPLSELAREKILAALEAYQRYRIANPEPRKATTK